MIDTEKYKEILEAELTELKIQLQSLGVQNSEVKEDWTALPDDVGMGGADPNVVGDRSENWQEKRGTLDALETRFNNIKRALKKLNDGDFGKCEICQSEIESERLEANGAARTCMVHLEEEANITLN